MKILLLLIAATHLSACCGGMKDAVHAYGSAAEDSAHATAELVKRCKAASSEPDGEAKNQDLAACDRAIQSLEVQKVAAGRLKGE
ncbi:MAG: hypothetical protein ACJ79U_02250 [Myxococcales bacterium]